MSNFAKGKNYTSDEEEKLIELVEKYYDGITSNEYGKKDKAWKCIMEEYNRHFKDRKRTVEQLKSKYFSLKKAGKIQLGDDPDPQPGTSAEDEIVEEEVDIDGGNATGSTPDNAKLQTEPPNQGLSDEERQIRISVLTEMMENIKLQIEDLQKGN